jgi:hypothetical protein
MKKWANEIRKVEMGKERGRRNKVSLAVIAANNHYAGFGPRTSNLFRKMVGLSELSWADQQQQIQERLRLRQPQQEQNVEISSSNMSSNNYTEKLQSSLTEFIE